MGVLVADDAHVQAAVGAGGVEGARDRLEEVLVRDARYAVLQGDLVGVVAAGGDAGLVEHGRGEGAGLDVAGLLVGRDAALAEVVQLHVVVRLGEAEVVAVVVHPVVGHEQVAGHVVDVVAAGHEVGRVAGRLVPGIGELTGVVAHRGDRGLEEAARAQRAAPRLVGVGVVADRGHRRGAGHVDLVPGEGRGDVGEGAGGLGAALGVGPAADHVVGRGLADLGRGHRRVGREVAPGGREAGAAAGGGGALVGGVDQQGVGADDGRGLVEGADLGGVDAGAQRLGRGVGRDLGAGEQVAGEEQPVLRAEELHDHVVGRQRQRDGGEGAGGVVGELEGVLGAALGAGEGALEDLLDRVVLHLVGTVQHVAGDRVDQERVGEGVAAGVVDDVGLVDRADGAVGEGQGAQAHLLLLGEAGHGQAGPRDRAGDGLVHALADLRERRAGDAAADVGRGLDPCLDGGQLGGGDGGGVGDAGQGGGDVGDLAAGDAHGDHRADRGGEVPEALAEQHGVAGLGGRAALRVGVGGEPLGVDQLQVGHRGAGQAEEAGVVLEEGAGRTHRVAGGRRGEHAVVGEE